jgi:mannose-6-phosphate isomerase-like protein (cupin superfamily)
MRKLFSCIVCSWLLVNGSLVIAQSQSKTDTKGKADTVRYTKNNCINHFSISKIESTKVGYQYWFADKNFADGKTLKMSVVGPHQATHPPHAHLEDEFFFVLEGDAELYFDGIWISAKPYTSYYCPSYREHGIRNAGDTELKYLVIKKYENVSDETLKNNKDH